MVCEVFKLYLLSIFPFSLYGFCLILEFAHFRQYAVGLVFNGLFIILRMMAGKFYPRNRNTENISNRTTITLYSALRFSWGCNPLSIFSGSFLQCLFLAHLFIPFCIRNRISCVILSTVG